jgi:hypothetical protein
LSQYKTFIIQIPGGSHTFLFDWQRTYGDTVYSSKDITFFYQYFIAGKSYALDARINNADRNVTVRVIEVEIREDGSYKRLPGQ